MLSMWKLRELTWGKLLRRTWSQFWEDRILDQSAKLSFYFLLSFFPLLVSLIALLGLILQSGPVLKVLVPVRNGTNRAGSPEPVTVRIF